MLGDSPESNLANEASGIADRTPIPWGGKEMPRQTDLSRPVDVYKAIIDELATETSRGISERLVAQEGIFSKAPDHRAFNTFVQSLSTDQRQVLAQMLHIQRTGAIHDVLAVLSWWVGPGKVGFTFRGESMPVGLSGMGLHGDYVGRQNDWEWPSDDSPAAT